MLRRRIGLNGPSLLFLAAGFLPGGPLLADWAPLGPFGGSAAVVAADPHSAGVFLAGTRNASLFRTADGGQSWIPLLFPAQSHATLNTLAVDPETPGVYLAGLSSDQQQYSGILRSTDRGGTWRQAPELRNQQVRAIAFKRCNPKLIAAGTDTGVFESRDGGETWIRISPSGNHQLQPVVSVVFHPNDNSTLYAGTPHLPWMTFDGGANWHSIASGMIDDSDIFSIQPDRNRPRRILAGACSGIYRSLDGGSTWSKLAGARDTSYRTYVIAQHPQYENIWFAGTSNGIVRSLDGGTTWERLGPYATRSIAFDSRRLGSILIATDQAGIQRSEDDGKSWAPANQGFCNRRLSAVWTSGGFVYTTALDVPAGGPVLRLAKDSVEWEEVPSTTAEAFTQGREGNDVVETRGRALLAATNAGLRASHDGGASWRPVPGELATETIQAICRHPHRPEVLFAAKFGVVYGSTDAGRSWTRISPPSWPIQSVSQLAVAPGSPDRLLVLTRQQGIWAWELGSEMIWRSSGADHRF